MNKKGLISGVVIAVAATAVVGPRFVGSDVEDSLKLHVNALNELPAYNASVVSFDRGWFGSTATIELGFDAGAAFAETGMPNDLSFEVMIDIQHGPVLVQFSPGLGLVAWHAHTKDDSLREFIDWEIEKSFYDLKGSLGFFGNLSYSDSISSFTTKADAQQLSVSFSGYEGSGEASSDNFSYQGTLDNAEIRLEDNVVNLDEIELSTEAQEDMLSVIQGELYEGHARLGLGKMVMRQSDATDLVNLQALAVEFVTTFNDDQESMNIDMNYLVEALKTDSFDLKNLTLNTAFNNIDTEFLLAYNETMKGIYGQEPDAIEVATKQLIEQRLPQLLKAEPEFVISEFSGAMEPGNFKGDLSAKLTGVTQLPDSLDDAAFWLSSLIVDASIAVDKPLLSWVAEQQLLATLRIQYPAAEEAELQSMAQQQVPMMINMYTQQGLLQENEDEYRSEFQMEDGEAVLNGQLIPLGNMM